MKRLVLVMALALIVAACGGTNDLSDAVANDVIDQIAGDNVDISTSDGGSITLSVDDAEGSGQASFGDKLPSDFPLPLPDGYEVGVSMQFEEESGTSYTAVIQVSADAFDATKAMYAAWFEAEDFTVDLSEFQGSEGQAAFFIADRDDVSASVSMTVEGVSNDAAGNITYATAITLTWTPLG